MPLPKCGWREAFIQAPVLLSALHCFSGGAASFCSFTAKLCDLWLTVSYSTLFAASPPSNELCENLDFICEPMGVGALSGLLEPSPMEEPFQLRPYAGQPLHLPG